MQTSRAADRILLVDDDVQLTLLVSKYLADDGPGIPPGRRERVFEPFTRLDDSLSKDSGGIGLGLAIVHAISVQLEGRDSVHDSEMGGAEFQLHWPRQQPTA